MANGKGIRIKTDGFKTQGFFKDDKLHGFVTQSKSNSTGFYKHEGEYFEGLKNGL